jgi:amidophosphoribosyltransferase
MRHRVTTDGTENGQAMSELNEECGIAAIYYLGGAAACPFGPAEGTAEITRLLPRMLLDIQNRGQLAAGITTYNPDRAQLLDTYKDVGTVTEVFRLAHRGKVESLMSRLAGPAGIGHVRYATCGRDDKAFAHPFERHGLHKHSWFSFAFNGQLANYGELRDELLAAGDYHLTRDTDTEILMHEFSRQLAGNPRPRLIDALRQTANRLDGAYTLVVLNAKGEMLVARDPLGIKPVSYAVQDGVFAAASESVALVNLGFDRDVIQSLGPGCAISIEDNEVKIEPFADSGHTAHCFFEWIYFANVASRMDGRSVYATRRALGEELARLELASSDVPLDDNTIVVPVPDTSKAAADAMAYRLRVPVLEGLIRNRYTGRTFIEGSDDRRSKVQNKYTPLREVLSGKRVLLVEDSIVRSTTMRGLLHRIREEGQAREIHVRVACPPIVAPCFYGIDMSSVDELFAPKFISIVDQIGKHRLTPEIEAAMADDLGADSLRYLPVEAIARAIGIDAADLCQACITGEYPTPKGQALYQIALDNVGKGNSERTYEGRSQPLEPDGPRKIRV